MNFSVPMALVDMIPVLFFGSAGIILMRDLYNKMSKGAFAIFSAGIIDIFQAGLLKALYKLLYAAGICDFKALSQMFFPVQAIGFALAGLGAVAMMVHEQGEGKKYAFAPAGLLIYGGMMTAGPVLGSELSETVTYFSGTMLFVAFMVLGLGCVNVVMSILSVKIKTKKAIPLFVLAFVFSMMMGYLSSKDFSQSYMNWAAEGVNTIGQGAFLVGVHILHKAGLADFHVK